MKISTLLVENIIMHFQRLIQIWWGNESWPLSFNNNILNIVVKNERSVFLDSLNIIQIYSATKIRVHYFTCIFQLFKLIADISAWYIRKEHSIPRSGRGRSCGYDYWERYTSWLNDIPPQTKSHKIVRSQRVLALWWEVFTDKKNGKKIIVLFFCCFF